MLVYQRVGEKKATCEKQTTIIGIEPTITHQNNQRTEYRCSEKSCSGAGHSGR